MEISVRTILNTHSDTWKKEETVHYTFEAQYEISRLEQDESSLSIFNA